MSAKEGKITHRSIVNCYAKDIEKLIRHIIKGAKTQDFWLREILHGGPSHKQVLSAMLLSNMSRKIFAKEKQSGSKFELAKGVSVFYEDEKEEVPVPVEFVAEFDEITSNKTAKLISKSPLHESIVYLITLQAMDWLAK